MPGTATTRRDTVTIRRCGQWIKITPARIDLLEAFQGLGHGAGIEPPYGFACLPVPAPLLFPQQERIEESDWLFGHAGLEPLVREFLENHGVSVRLTGDLPKPLPVPQSTSRRYKGLAPDHDFLNFVRTHDRGLIECGPKTAPVWLIAQAAVAWPEARISVWVTRVRDAKWLCGELKSMGLDVEAFYGGHCLDLRPQILIATPACLDDARATRRDLAFIIEAEHIFDRYTRDNLQCANAVRLFGFIPRKSRFPSHLRGRLISVFGVEPFVLPAHGSQMRDVGVVPIRLEHGRPLPKQLSALAVKQQAIWFCQRRNRDLVAFARWLAGAPIDTPTNTLRRLIAAVDGQRPPSCAILVETVEHALQLARHLPQWRVLAKPLGRTGPLNRQRNGQLDLAKRQGDPQHAIVTAASWDSQQEFDVIVNATATAAPVASEQVVSTWPCRKLPVVLIDLQDRYHPLLAKWARMRMAGYRDANWEIQGQDRPTLLERFERELTR